MEMSTEFHDWLNQCPVQWLRLSHDEINEPVSSVYQFIENDREKDD